MQSAKRYLIIAFSFAVALTVFAAFTPRIAHAITATLVQVVNTAANPVPVQPVGPTTVQGTVGIDPASSGVTVNSLPAVQLASGGSSDQPLFTRDSDNAARQAFSIVRTCQIAIGAHVCNMANFAVPQGKRAVIETVGFVGLGYAQLTRDLNGAYVFQGGGASVELGIFNGTDNALFGFAAQSDPSENPLPSPVGTWQTRLYADPGTQVSVAVLLPLANENNGGQSLLERVALMGYYVDVQ